MNFKIDRDRQIDSIVTDEYKDRQRQIVQRQMNIKIKIDRDRNIDSIETDEYKNRQRQIDRQYRARSIFFSLFV